MPRIPEWLTVDLMIIAMGMVFIGVGVPVCSVGALAPISRDQAICSGCSMPP